MDPIDESATAAPLASLSHPTEAQRQILWTALTALAVVTLLGVAALVFLGFISFLGWCYPILLPVGLAVIVALILDPFVNLIQKRGLDRGNATLIVCLLAVSAFLLFWAPMVKLAGDFFYSLPASVNEGITQIEANLTDSLDHDSPDLAGQHPDLSAITNAPPAADLLPSSHPLEAAGIVPTPTVGALDSGPPAKYSNGHSKIIAWIKSNLPALQDTAEKNIAKLAYAIMGPVGQAFGFILGFGFVPIYVYYFLADQDQLSKHWHDYVPLRRSALRDEVVSVLTEINTSLVSYFRGQIIVAACNGVLSALGLWLIIGFPNNIVLGVITGALSIIPFLGIIASIIPAMLLAFLSANGDHTRQWLLPLLVVGVFTLVQMSESMFITPRVQSHSTGLHPLAIILGILFWSLLLPGLLGPIVAVPLTCSFMVLLRRYVWQEKKT